LLDDAADEWTRQMMATSSVGTSRLADMTRMPVEVIEGKIP
jgi:hypothetical protein